jgi:hypothetical protein
MTRLGIALASFLAGVAAGGALVTLLVAGKLTWEGRP